LNWTPRTEWAARLNAIPFVDPAKAIDLLDGLGPDRLPRAGDSDWATTGGLTPDRAARWRGAALSFDAEGERRKADALGARLLVMGDRDYPGLLAGLPDAPLALYARGTLSEATSVAVVGSRAPTEYGRRMAKRFAGGLARRRVVVVSGLARGIDAEAHEAALDAGGTTWAVLGSGLGEPYPPDNIDLFHRIVSEGGCVVSEYPLGLAPSKGSFPRRNRIIAGLSWATVVVEGRNSSGSMSTAKKATEYGRDVLAVPGPVDSPMSEAPHRLLRDGARVAAAVEDVLAVLPAGAGAGPVTPRPALPAADGDEAAVMAHLRGESLSLDELARLTGLDMGRLSLIMFGLEIKELVSAVPGQRYAKKTL
jgi:DNA processing protein